jgi:hypothetical protein
MKYGIVFWGKSAEAGRIFIIQKACLRAIYKIKPRETCADTFKSANILTMPSVFILECAALVRSNYEECLKKFELTHGQNTRGVAKNFLRPPPTHLTRIQNSALYQCIKVYNHIPAEVKGLPDKKFKTTLRHFLVQRAFYRIEDFFDTRM